MNQELADGTWFSEVSRAVTLCSAALASEPVHQKPGELAMSSSPYGSLHFTSRATVRTDAPSSEFQPAPFSARRLVALQKPMGVVVETVLDVLSREPPSPQPPV